MSSGQNNSIERICAQLQRLGRNGKPLSPAELKELVKSVASTLIGKVISDATIARAVRRRLLEEVQITKPSVPNDEVKHWDRIISKRLCFHLHGRGVGVEEPADLAQTVRKKLIQAYYLRSEQKPLSESYIATVVRSVIVDAIRRRNRGDGDAAERQSEVLVRPRVEVCDLTATGAGLDQLADPQSREPSDEACASELRKQCVNWLNKLPRNRQSDDVRVQIYGGWGTTDQRDTTGQTACADKHKTRRSVAAGLQAARKMIVPPPRPQEPCELPGADRVIHALVSNDVSRLYVLDHLYTGERMEQIVAGLRRLPQEVQDGVCAKLVTSYVRNSWLTQTHRQTTVYLLSRLPQPRGCDYVRELRNRRPNPWETALYRGYHIALGFLGDVRAGYDYAAQIDSRDRGAWGRQRDFNRQFHTYYYGTEEAALVCLRQEIRKREPQNLLALDVVTLGMMSSNHCDLELLDEGEADLLGLGIPRSILERARVRIMRNGRSGA